MIFTLLLLLQDDPVITQFENHLKAESHEKAALLFRQVVADHDAAAKNGDKAARELAVTRLVRMSRRAFGDIVLRLPQDDLTPLRIFVSRLFELRRMTSEQKLEAHKAANDSIRDKLRNLGIPDGFKSLLEEPAQPQDNAADVYEKIYSSLRDTADEKDPASFLHLAVDRKTAVQHSTLAAAHVKKFAPILEQTREALARKTCQIELHPELGSAIELPSLLGNTRLAKALQTCALAQSALNQHRAARDTALLLLRVSTHAVREPLFVSALIQCALLSQAFQTIEQVFLAELPTLEELDAFDRALDAWDPHRIFSRAVQGDACLMVPTLENLVFKMMEGKLTTDIEIVLYEDLGCGLDAMIRLRQLFHRDWFEIQKDLNAFNASIRDLPWMSRIQIEGVIPIVKSANMCMAKTRLLRAAFSAYRHQARHGKLPDTLDLPLDPFTGKPLRFENGVLSIDGKEELRFKLR